MLKATTFAFGLLYLGGGIVGAQSNCAARDVAVHYHSEKLRQSVQSRAIDQSGNMLEIWADLKVGSWAAVLTSPDGLPCMMSYGTGYQRFKPGTAKGTAL